VQVASPSTDLSPDDLRHVEAAGGFFGLGLHEEAWNELEEVQPTARATAEVLALRVEILLAEGRADYARTIAAGAVRMHPEAGQCHYTLALAEAKAGNFPAVKGSLAAAFRASPELKAPALDDERLGE
jgi:hypothetical protein